jgi:hypothetical protein
LKKRSDPVQSIDLPQLVKELNGLAEVFDKKQITDKASKVWFDTLKEFPTERVLGILIGWPKTHNKFPAPSDVWKVCNESGIEEREHKARTEKAMEPKWERTPQGALMLKKIKDIINKPARTPRQHWEHALITQRPGSIGFEYAKKVLKIEDREPGEDDEPQAVNF